MVAQDYVAACPMAAPASCCGASGCTEADVQDSNSVHDRPSRGRWLLASVKGTKKRVLIQRHVLVVFYHAVQCREVGTCAFSNTCKAAQELLKHTHACKAAPGTCSHPRCECTKRLLAHHRGCRSPTCPVCVPVRRTVRRQRQRAEQGMPPVPQPAEPSAGTPSSSIYSQRPQMAAGACPHAAYGQQQPVFAQQPVQLVRLQDAQQVAAQPSAIYHSGVPVQSYSAMPPNSAAPSYSHTQGPSLYSHQPGLQQRQMQYCGQSGGGGPCGDDDLASTSSDDEGATSPSSSILALMQQMRGPVAQAPACSSTSGSSSTFGGFSPRPQLLGGRWAGRDGKPCCA